MYKDDIKTFAKNEWKRFIRTIKRYSQDIGTE